MADAALTRRDTQWIDRSINMKIPERPAALVRISEDPLNLEKGVKRQWDDALRVKNREHWQGELQRIYENDTSAYKRRWLTLPDGTRVRRVVRPEFDEMLRKIYAGEIDGLIVYDLDRLVRQNRQLEDLIDAVEHMGIPVLSASSGNVNLLTSDGRASARMLCTMALKQSEDTARRVARAAFTDAQEGKSVRGGPRRFGWDEDGRTVRVDEANALRIAASRATRGESLWSICLWLHETDTRPVDPPRKKKTQSSGKFNRTSLNNLLRSPRLGGIRMYAGVGRGRQVPINDWRNRVMVKDGEYVMGDWDSILTVEEWEALQHALDAGSRPNRSVSLGGAPIGGQNARKYLLTSLLRCGACGAKMTGKPASKRRAAYYQCLSKDQGGCNGVSRDMKRVDDLVRELLMRAMEQEALIGEQVDRSAEEIERAEAAIKRITASKDTARERWRAGKYDSDSDYYADVDALTAELKQQKAIVDDRHRVSSRKIEQHPRKAWEAANLSQRMTMLHRYFTHITIKPQETRGRYGWRDEHIVPGWRSASPALPGGLPAPSAAE